MRRAFLVVAPVFGAALIACQLLIGIDDRKVPDTMMMTGDADPCMAIGYPLRPDQSTSSPSDSIDRYFALYSVDTGTNQGTIVRPWGLNLDQKCTCPGPNSCAGSKQFCDREAGLDDEGQFVFTELQAAAASFDASAFFSDALFNKALQSGVSGLLVRIRGYNGQANDASVQVAIYSSPGWEGPDGGMPGWNGNDSWLIDQDYVMMADPNSPKYEVSGWVSDFTLVASPSQIPIVIGNSFGQPVRLRLDNGYILAKLQLAGGMPTAMVGTLAGRWKALDFLDGLRTVPDPINMNEKLCQSSLTYAIVAGTVCKHRDINADKGLDNVNAPCDAVSFGIGFEARFAKANTVVAANPGMPGCSGWKASCP